MSMLIEKPRLNVRDIDTVRPCDFCHLSPALQDYVFYTGWEQRSHQEKAFCSAQCFYNYVALWMKEGSPEGSAAERTISQFEDGPEV